MGHLVYFFSDFYAISVNFITKDLKENESQARNHSLTWTHWANYVISSGEALASLLLVFIPHVIY